MTGWAMTGSYARHNRRNALFLYCFFFWLFYWLIPIGALFSYVSLHWHWSTRSTQNAFDMLPYVTWIHHWFWNTENNFLTQPVVKWQIIYLVSNVLDIARVTIEASRDAFVTSSAIDYDVFSIAWNEWERYRVDVRRSAFLSSFMDSFVLYMIK